MTAQEQAWQAAESAAAVLGPEAGVFASADSAGLGEATLAVLKRAAQQRAGVGAAWQRFFTSVAAAGPGWRRLLAGRGGPAAGGHTRR